MNTESQARCARKMRASQTRGLCGAAILAAQSAHFFHSSNRLVAPRGPERADGSFAEFRAPGALKDGGETVAGAAAPSTPRGRG